MTAAIKLRIPRGTNGQGRLTGHPIVRTALIVFVAVSTFIVGSFYYYRYDQIIHKRFQSPVFSNTAKIYAIPRVVRVGDKITAKEIGEQLHRAGYSENGEPSTLGSYYLGDHEITISPGYESYHSPDEATIRIQGGKVDRIRSLSGELTAYELEPQLVTGLFDAEQRFKRQIVKYDDIPKRMVEAVLAIEDRRFFQHGGVNYLRLAQAAWFDLTHRRHQQGGSTITMQLSRAFFLTPEKTLKRKLLEMLIAVELEQKFTKQQIFEFYVNRVDLGQCGSFTIRGFAEASRAYFNEDLRNITLPEAALLAGLIQAPSYLSPYYHPERALERRNIVLEAMVGTHAITREQADKAKATPLKLALPTIEASDAPYFVDLVHDTLISRLDERKLNEQSYRIYTTLDPDLQNLAIQAVETGIKLADSQVTALRTKRIKIGKYRYETKAVPGPEAQVALVAMDPHTGQVLALVGGRDHGFSRRNHAVAKRPTGSIFKPFVYATALNTALNGSEHVLTPVSKVPDRPPTFSYGHPIYEPRNYKEEYHSDVTLRDALALSLNNATVKVAEEVGYDKVSDLAKSAGISSVRSSLAMALGAYDATPLDMAAAYTAFVNGGVRVSPVLVNSVRGPKGETVMDFHPDKRPILDPRIAYVMTDMLEGALNFGTGYSGRPHGFTAPLAGITGTSHDGWFAGYSSNLLCIVWVGFDDYSDLRLSGAQTAAPIWAEFMNKALALSRYSDVNPFTQPTGVVNVRLEKATNRLATAACSDTYTAAFIAGTEPHDTCDQDEPNVSNVVTTMTSKPGPVL